MTEFKDSFWRVEQAIVQAHGAEREAILQVAHEIDPALHEELLRIELEKELDHQAAIAFLEAVHPGSGQRVDQLIGELLGQTDE
jgi:hypothetical protein